MAPTALPTAITLDAIVEAIDTSRVSPALPPRFYVERLGGNVYGLADYAGRTVTINGGQRSVDVTEDGPADVLVCLDGARVAEGTASTVADVVALLTAATA